MVMLSQTCGEGGGSTSWGGCWLGIATCIFYQSTIFRRAVLQRLCSGFVRWEACVIVGERKVPNAEAP
eukprot:4408343-Pleurochrysis_carterae.AAC.1